MVLFVEYPKCTTCRKAKVWLDSNGIEYVDRHIKEDNPKLEELKSADTISRNFLIQAVCFINL